MSGMVEHQKRAVFILGAPRSGTSVTTGVLGQLGLYLGDKLTPAGSWNPKGDYEDENTVVLNRELIRTFGICPRNASTKQPIDFKSHEESPQAIKKIQRVLKKSFNGSQQFGLKHPRVCLLLPLYLQAAQELGYEPNLVIVSRDSRDVVKSLNKSEKQIGDEYTMAEGLAFVNQFLRPIGQYAADYNHVRITFDDITKRTPTAIEKIRRLLPELQSYRQNKLRIDQFVTPAPLLHKMQDQAKAERKKAE